MQIDGDLAMELFTVSMYARIKEHTVMQTVLLSHGSDLTVVY